MTTEEYGEEEAMTMRYELIGHEIVEWGNDAEDGIGGLVIAESTLSSVARVSEMIVAANAFNALTKGGVEENGVAKSLGLEAPNATLEMSTTTDALINIIRQSLGCISLIEGDAEDGPKEEQRALEDVLMASTALAANTKVLHEAICTYQGTTPEETTARLYDRITGGDGKTKPGEEN